MEQSNNDRYTVPGLERGLRLLSEFQRDQPILSAAELMKRLNVPRSTLFRLLVTLENAGFIEKVEGGHSYKLGMSVLKLGFEYLASQDLPELCHPILKKLRDQANFSSNLVVLDETYVVFLAKAPIQSPYASHVSVGTRLPAHATLLGRVLLSDKSLDEIQALYHNTTLETSTSYTPKSVQELYALIQEDKKVGYVFGKGYFESSIATIAAPVFNLRKAVIAAVGITIPILALEKSKLTEEELIQHVKDAAKECSALLGYKV